MFERPPNLLIVEDDRQLADQLRWALKDDYRIDVARRREDALAGLRSGKPDMVLLDLCLPPRNTPEEGFDLLEVAHSAGVLAVVMSALGERDAALRAIRQGAYDFFDKPVDVAALRVVIRRALERKALELENQELRRRLHESHHLGGIVGRSPEMQRVFEAVRRVADTPVPVMIQGESGTGKGLVARALHYNSSRRDGPFISVHCAAFPDTLLEAELFGHEKGAFTGASGARVGRFEAAGGGTLFLDEIACISPSIQIKLLRVLEERTVERLGSNQPRPVDFRLIAATNEDLEKKVREGACREDFYFRVKGFPIPLPPLRERVEDVPLLADHFLKGVGEVQGMAPKRLSGEARAELMAREWPGNVRELRNVVETVALLADGECIGVDDVARACPARDAAVPELAEARVVGLKTAVGAFEKRVLVDAIQRADGVKARAARELRLDPGQMKYLARKHGI
jgi:DNA-binding NtrC family response regulator